ncbi:Diacylglycerol O-acyltransferase 1 [Zancudomyces culisetae]|uniref:O-acyltransferase n=1 Tax=Zancudomyces culisetae TaxID=1213189 RepID=A0A1R1PR62_ZANCU|nr:Diacylglycerol O-acyltransferase 1 [Zancudomyces culisetae]|eukprot:OMH83421.1 Diacylglycerol O-acyltransferase 1 [Zancudomyces culisetae]
MDELKNENAKPAQGEITKEQSAGENKQAKQKRAIVYKPYNQMFPVHKGNKFSALDPESPPAGFDGFINFGVHTYTLKLRALCKKNTCVGEFYEIWLDCWENGTYNHKYRSGLFWVEKTFAKQAIGLRKKLDKKSMNEQEIRVVMRSELAKFGLQFANMLLTLLVPAIMVRNVDIAPVLGITAMFSSVVMSLKLYSWSITNLDLRRAYILGDDEFLEDPMLKLKLKVVRGPRIVSSGSNETDANDAGDIKDTQESKQVPPANTYLYQVKYPDNICISNLAYFWAAPTFCYQPNYPRTESVRWSYVFSLIQQMLCCSFLAFFAIFQFAFPTMENSIPAFESGDYLKIVERTLKLGLIVSGIWILGSYCLFHCGLNIVAELLRFGDRQFYDDWWNSVDLSAYWRKWNRPIHNFCKRHILVPLLSPPLYFSKFYGSLVTFFVSAVLHEVIIGIPTHSTRMSSFWGMLLQLPLISFTTWVSEKRGPHTRIGNCIFWISFCIFGQPFATLGYYYDYVKHASGAN